MKRLLLLLSGGLIAVGMHTAAVAGDDRRRRRVVRTTAGGLFGSGVLLAMGLTALEGSGACTALSGVTRLDATIAVFVVTAFAFGLTVVGALAFLSTLEGR